jgi:hypothetical protein
VKFVGVDAVPPAVVTTSFPVVAPVGTEVTRLVVLNTVNGAATPLNVTLVAASKLAPTRVTAVPRPPVAGVKLVMDGGGTSVKVADTDVSDVSCMRHWPVMTVGHPDQDENCDVGELLADNVTEVP